MLFGAVSVQADSTFGYFTLNMVRPNKADLVLRQYNAFTPLCYSGVPVQWPAVDPTARRFPAWVLGSVQQWVAILVGTLNSPFQGPKAKS